MLDQLMALAHLQRDRPVQSQISMRAIEEPERGYHEHRAKPRSERQEAIISEREPRCEKINGRQEQAARNNDGHKSLFHRIRSEEHTSELQSRLHLVCRLL